MMPNETRLTYKNIQIGISQEYKENLNENREEEKPRLWVNKVKDKNLETKQCRANLKEKRKRKKFERKTKKRRKNQ